MTEVVRQADEVAETVLCHELHVLETRYAKLEGLIQRLVELVQRDCPGTLMEFMERGQAAAKPIPPPRRAGAAMHRAKPRAMLTTVPELVERGAQTAARPGPPPERAGAIMHRAEPQIMLPAVPAASWEVLASKPPAYDGIARHRGVGFGGPHVERVGGVPFWDLSSGAVLQHAEGPAPQLGPEYTLACWVHWRPAAGAADVRTLLCGEGGSEWLQATGDALGSYSTAADASLNLGLGLSLDLGGDLGLGLGVTRSKRSAT